MSNKNYGGAYREIFVKAVCARGKERFHQVHSFKPSHEPERILGCWVANHRCMARPTSDSVIVDGQYDVNVWYAFNNNTQTEIVKGTIAYTETVPVESIGGDSIGSDAEVRATVTSEPHCVSRALKKSEDGSGSVIQIEIEKEFYAEVICETKLVVRAVPASALDEDEKKDDDWEIYTDEIDDDFSEDDMEEDESDIGVG